MKPNRKIFNTCVSQVNFLEIRNHIKTTSHKQSSHTPLGILEHYTIRIV